MNKATFTVMMIAAVNYDNSVQFYHLFVGLDISKKTEAYNRLKDKESGQMLCITNGESVKQTSPGIKVADMQATLRMLEELGGHVIKQWVYASMEGANCMDSEGNEVLIWQTLE